jgi:hypothetical protein
MTLPVRFPVTAGAAGVGFGTLIPTGGFGEPCRWPGELVGPDVEGPAVAVALDGVGVGLGVRVGLGVTVGTTGTGEMAEWVAGGAAEDDAASDDAAAEGSATAAEPAAELAAVAELTATELPGA